MTKFEIVRLHAGINTIKSNEYQETFHPGIGPMAEARIYADDLKLVKRAASGKDFVIWDVGLGAAANAIGAIEAVMSVPEAKVEIHSFDKSFEPLAFALEKAAELEYPAAYRSELKELITRGETRVGSVAWKVYEGDFRDTMQDPNIPKPDAILYDPYSSATNQELWNLEHFTNLRACLGDEKAYLLTNYTSSSAMRVTLLMAGFYVGIGTATGKKKETTVVSNRLDRLDRPLSRLWLEKRKNSQSSSPLRIGDFTPRTITDEEFATLRQHPQFA